MKEAANQIGKIIEEVTKKTKGMDLSGWNIKASPKKWSKNEIMGHLVDSANNNLQRFVRGTYEENFKIVYNQNEWVEAQHYNWADTKELLLLWTLINKQIIRILQNYPLDRIKILCNTGKEEISLHSIEFLANDYVDHLRHHLKQIH